MVSIETFLNDQPSVPRWLGAHNDAVSSSPRDQCLKTVQTLLSEDDKHPSKYQCSFDGARYFAIISLPHYPGIHQSQTGSPGKASGSEAPEFSDVPHGKVHGLSVKSNMDRL